MMVLYLCQDGKKMMNFFCDWQLCCARAMCHCIIVKEMFDVTATRKVFLIISVIVAKAVQVPKIGQPLEVVLNLLNHLVVYI